MSTLSGSGGTSIYIKEISGSFYWSSNNSNYTIFSFPATIQNINTGAGTLTVIFTTDLTLSSTSYYFSCGSSDIQFGSNSLNIDGTRPTIYIQVANYVGLISNGTAGSNGYNNISVYNLIVDGTGGSLGTDGGWIGRTNYAKNASNNIFVNCSSKGAITSGGGICGSYSGNNGGELTLTNCTSSGNISGTGGGMIGYYSSYHPGSLVTINSCSSTGSIGINCGGIFGYGCCGSGGSVNATNCYSTGGISSGGGGIYGGNTMGTSSATNCYSTGIIDGGGGIYGSSAGAASGNATATNCFTTGDIINNGGGIYGPNFNGTGAFAYNCYTIGSKSGSLSGGIWYNSISDTLQGVNNYAESNHNSSGWSDTHARQYLTGTPSSSPVGSIWAQLNGIGTAYILSTAGYSPYTTTLGTTTSESITAGQSTSAAIVSGYTHSLLSINNNSPSLYTSISIDSTTGSITADTTTVANIYTIHVYSSINPYSITTYTLTVSSSSSGGSSNSLTVTGSNVSCCDIPLNLDPNIGYETRNKFITGNTLLGQSVRRLAYPSYIFYSFKQMATFGK